METGNGRLAFWSSLYSITDLYLNKKEKLVTLNFYDEPSKNEYHLKFYIENIVLFKDTLVKKMHSLRVKTENTKLIPGLKRQRLSRKEIETMNIDDIENNIIELQVRITSGEVNEYTVNTFTTLCGKAIDHFAQIGHEKHLAYLTLMKTILNLESIQRMTVDELKLLDENQKDSE
ncbi:MAG: hypothetical protein MJ252_27230 [archaeon]|nr:hypothetical protein [archaeon]